MADCSSSFLAPNPPLFPSQPSSDLKNSSLPPRKRLLASLKNVAIPTIDHDSHSVDVSHASPSHVNSTQPVFSPTSPPQCLPIEKCTSCGDSGVLVHLVSDLSTDSTRCHYCSSCVLSSYKQMYCFLCLQVIKKGLPSSTSSSSLLACCKCQRLSHADCTRKLCPSSLDECDPVMCYECRDKGSSKYHHARKRDGPELQSKRRKKAYFDSARKDPPPDNHSRRTPVVDRETLTAARVVAAVAEKEAYMAKQRAMEMAKIAASAALRAQVALDTAYDLSHPKVGGSKQDDYTVRHHDEEQNAGNSTTIKSPRGSKKRALSAIVESEKIYSKKLENSTAPAKKRKHMVSGDHASADVSDDDDDNDDNACIASLKCVKGGMKRKKSLSAIGMEMNAVCKYKGSKLPASSKCRSTKLSTKGKLGTIFSRALALGKGEKKSWEASNEGRDSRCHAQGATTADGDVPHIVLEPRLYQKNAIDSNIVASKGHMPRASAANGSDSLQHDPLITPKHDTPVKGHPSSCYPTSEASKANNLGDHLEKGSQSGIKEPNVNGERVSEQERRLFEFLNRTLESNKAMLSRVSAPSSIMQKK